MTRRAAPAPLVRMSAADARTDQDLVAVEAPLLVRVRQPGSPDPVALGVLLRTPGDDEDLVRGLLFAEGVIAGAGDLAGVVLRREPASDGDAGEVAEATVNASVDLTSIALQRALITTSACGLCGRLEPTRLERTRRVESVGTVWEASMIARLPDRLKAAQAVFHETGGLHAAAIVDAGGAPLVVREDVGRHNAVDKAVGAALAAGDVPNPRALLMVSGRVAYEIVQKAAAADLGGVVAVGAPSSLAIEAARRAGLLLVGFVRDGRFNVYHGAHRVRGIAAVQ